MGNDATLVTSDLVQNVMNATHQQLENDGVGPVIEEIGKTEPILASLIQKESERLVGQLVLCGAPSEAARCFFGDFIGLAATSVLALQQAHSNLWEGFDLPVKHLPATHNATEMEQKTQVSSDEKLLEDFPGF